MSNRGVFLYILVQIWVTAGAGLAPSDAAAQSGFVTETVDSAGDVGWQTSIALDHLGFPHIGYIAPSPLFDLKYASKSASGWSVETASTHGNPISSTSLVLDSNDNPAMATGGDDALYVFKVGGTWTEESIGGFATWFVALALDDNDVPRMLQNWSVYKEFYSHVVYATRTGPGVWSGREIAGGPFVPSSPDYSLAIDATGDGHVAAVQTNGDTLRYWHITGTATFKEKFAPASSCDIALDVLGHPWIVYYDVAQADLMLLVSDGVSWAASTVDDAGDVGRYCSMVLGADGSCHISYYDADSGDLKYAARAAAAGAWNIKVVDAGGDVGQWTSIALDEAGRPHIAYYDVTRGDLEYATLSPPVPVSKTTWGALKTMIEGR
jgi:hypothetical protein